MTVARVLRFGRADAGARPAGAPSVSACGTIAGTGLEVYASSDSSLTDMPFCLATARICFVDRRPALFRKRALAALALVAACGGDDPSSPSNTDPKPGHYTVTLTTD